MMNNDGADDGQDERRMALFAQYAVAAAAEAIEDAGLQNLSDAEKENVVRRPPQRRFRR
jgi:3-oxoacyl-(acyl-carrier-protein) synthase